MQNQLRAPTAMGVMFPAGLLGLACAAMLGAFISTHDTYLHSWGTILIQDVILPFRKKPFTPRQHLWLLRGSIFGVAVFIFFFSLIFEHTQYIAMFLTISGAIFFGGAGAAIIGGLYWKRGSTAGAWSAMITGMSLSLVKIALEKVNPTRLHAALDHPLWGLPARAILYVQDHITDQVMTFFIILAAIAAYGLVSLFGPRTVFNMDRLLHRGKYADPDELAQTARRAPSWLEKLGFTREFTGTDRIVTYITLSWPLAWTAIFLGVTAYNLVFEVTPATWAAYWHGWTWFVLACGVAVTIWFTIGGIRDLRDMFRRLRTYRENPLDDGRVEQSTQTVGPDEQGHMRADVGGEPEP
jgi:SSS family solute:Na+ symporter